MRWLLLAAAMVCCAFAASADEIKLIFATTNTPDNSSNTKIMHPWAERVNAEGKGIVQLDVRDGFAIANQSNFYSRAMDDVVQVTWGLPSQVAGTFPRSLVGALPFLVDNAEHASIAFWRLYETGLLDPEYSQIHPFFVCGFPQYSVHTAKPMASPDDLSGLKFGVNSKIGGDIVGRLGGAPVAMLLSDFYAGLQRGTIDGVLNSEATLASFKLDEVTSYHVVSRLGTAIGVVFMTRKRWDALPAAARKVFDDNSGEKQSRNCGVYTDANESASLAAVENDPRQKVVTLTAAQTDNWRRRLEPILDEWAQATPDGAKVLSKFRELSDQAMAGH